jgi:hypothetical protein
MTPYVNLDETGTPMIHQEPPNGLEMRDAEARKLCLHNLDDCYDSCSPPPWERHGPPK